MNPDVVLISGWAMPASALRPFADALATHCRVLTVAPHEIVASDSTLCDWPLLVDCLEQQITSRPVILVGWSLGGALAVEFASRRPKRVHSIVTLGFNPCFVRKNDWPSAMPEETFADFSDSISRDFADPTRSLAEALTHFFRLCSLGCSRPAALSRTLKKEFGLSEEPSRQPLQKLLGLLESDIRPSLSKLGCPVTHCLGRQDALVPHAVLESMKIRYPQHTFHTQEGGHCFFLDDHSAVVSLIHAQVKQTQVKQTCLKHTP